MHTPEAAPAAYKSQTMTAQEIAARLQVSTRTFARRLQFLYADGMPPPVVGGDVRMARWSRRAVENWIEGGTEAAVAEARDALQARVKRRA